MASWGLLDEDGLENGLSHHPPEELIHGERHGLPAGGEVGKV